ncbi:hypothetical protein DL96DRAFT_1707177 [Flagelloscypha sp. PMI_526]|nr:hypothetical protein DL96DRAFT_1707177 [Flagelloscypha sp. PMI_526]
MFTTTLRPLSPIFSDVQSAPFQLAFKDPEPVLTKRLSRMTIQGVTSGQILEQEDGAVLDCDLPRSRPSSFAWSSSPCTRPELLINSNSVADCRPRSRPMSYAGPESFKPARLSYRQSLPADFDDKKTYNNSRMLNSSRRAIENAVPTTWEGPPKPLLLGLRHGSSNTAPILKEYQNIKKTRMSSNRAFKRLVLRVLQISAVKKGNKTSKAGSHLRPLSLPNAHIPINNSYLSTSYGPSSPSNSIVVEIIRWVMRRVLSKGIKLE